jgi:hypothetical protein
MGKNKQIADKIIAEVDNDPAGLGYKNPDTSWKTVDEIWTLGTTENQQVDDTTRRTDRDFLAALGFDGVNDLMEKFAKYANAHKGFAIAERAMHDYSEGGGIVISHPQFTAAITFLSDGGNMAAIGLVAGDALSAGQVDAITAVGKKTMSRFTAIGIPINRKFHVRRAKEIHDG